MKTTKFVVLACLALFLVVPGRGLCFTEPSNATYECQPIFLANAVPPNILVILDNSGSMTQLAVPSSQTYAGPPVGTTTYYGYFNPDYFYEYSSNTFVHKYKKVEYVGTPGSGGYWKVEDLAGNPHNLLDSEIETGSASTGLWDGNFLNYAAMRRIDVVRKVLVGGLATSRTGGGNSKNIGYSSTNYYNHGLYDPGVAVSPFGGSRIYEVYNGYLDVYSNWTDWASFSYDARFTIRVDKVQAYDPDDFGADGNLAGVLQKVGDRARWGNEWFNEGRGNNESGGFISNTIGSNLTSLVTDIENTAADTWTPLAEAYYVAVQYFAQEDIDYSATDDYKANLIPNNNKGQDPYWNGSEYVSCAKSFVILLTDGASTMDSDIPSFLKDYDGDGDDDTGCSTSDESSYNTCDYSSAGTNYLDDIALYARTTDLRSSTKGKTEIEGDQNLILYTVYAAFGGSDPNAVNLLKAAAKNGGFEDKNGNNLPDLTSEWDEDGDGDPDTYYDADNGYQLEQQLLSAIYDILKRASSGTAVSVLSTTGEGEGTLTQAFFFPKVNKYVQSTGSIDEFEWLGYLKTFWVDTYGYLREDTPDVLGAQDQTLDVTEDKVIAFVREDASGNECYSGEARVRVCEVSSSDPYPDPGTDCTPPAGCADYAMDGTSYHPLWSAGMNLAETSPSDRRILTFIDKDEDGVVDDGSTWSSGTDYSQFDTANEIIELDGSAASLTAVTPYLGVEDNATWSHLGATHATRVSNIVNWIRGTDISGLRSRTFDHDDSSLTVDATWKLGDIIHSTPVTVAKPVENYHLIYADESYQDYLDAFKDRETVVYVGANDGMLHAFTGWKYDSTNNKFEKPTGAPAGEEIGDEIWAYIPQALLPHLKWLPDPDYVHTYYVDLKPKVFDAKILPDDTHYTDSDTDPNWGTFLLVGLNLGGGTIQANEDFDYNFTTTGAEVRTFSPSYTLIDITEPRNPRVLWERSYDNLQMTTSIPAVVKVGDSWFAVFGSGPEGCSGESSQSGYLFVVDLLTGDPYQNGSNDWLFTTGSSNAFVNSPVSLDKNLNFNVDAIYFGEASKTGSNWSGKVYRVLVPWVCSDPDVQDCYDYSASLDYGSYVEDPKDASNPWFLFEIADVGEPVTAPLSLSVDTDDNLWIYGGTGRFFSDSDKTYSVDQYAFGIKDPFYNENYAPATVGSPTSTEYFRNYSSSVASFSESLKDVTGYVVSTAEKVYDSSLNYVSTFDELIEDISANYDGWIRGVGSGERFLEKPAVLGGIVFMPSFTPNSSTCGFGGSSKLYGLYFETGTAYTSAVFTNGEYSQTIGSDTVTLVKDYIDLGKGLASRMNIHIGAEGGAKGFIQKSTGEIITEQVSTKYNLKSGLFYWKER